MTSYQQKQRSLIQEMEQNFQQGRSHSSVVKPVKDYRHDTRIALTSVVFLPAEKEEKIIREVIEPLQKADRRHYYYLPKTLHITIQNIRTISDPPLFTKEDIEKAQRVFEKIIPQHSPISFQIKRLFELPTSLAMCAFSDETLKNLILDLRKELIKAGVPDNKTYASDEIFFGNVTIARYADTPNQAFFETVSKLKNVDIGEVTFKKVSLITTNAVSSPYVTTVHGECEMQ